MLEPLNSTHGSNEISNVSLQIITTTFKSTKELCCNNKIGLNNVHHYNCDFVATIHPSMLKLVVATNLQDIERTHPSLIQ
jgi:hypothetical protein